MTLDLGNIRIGDDCPIFIVAELSANHGRDIRIALDSIEMIKSCGADAVKVQTYRADTITIDSDREFFKINHGTIWDGQSLFKLYQEASMPWEWTSELKKKADDVGLVFFSSPFDPTAVDFLESISVPMYKVASLEITDIPLIEYIAATGKPVILSTGIARQDDIQQAMDACRRKGNEQLVLLKCTSAYPAPMDELNLATMKEYAERFSAIVGISDHTLGIVAPVVATALGAKLIEKHFIIDRGIGGPDSSFSLDPGEFAQMVKAVRAAEQAIGRVEYELTERQISSRRLARSLFVVADIVRGEKFSINNIRSIRPGDGLHPRHFEAVLGRQASRDVVRGTPLSWDMIDPAGQ